MEPYENDHMAAKTDLVSHITDIMQVIYDELDDSKKYIKAAMSHRDIDKALADSLCNMSAQELQHAEILMNSVTSAMEKLKTGGDACYDTMSKVCTHTKERQMEYAAWIRQLHAQYKK